MSPLGPNRLDPDLALQLAATAARRHGVEAPVRPLRAGANHVFRAGDVVVRVAPPSADVSSQVALARWLASEGFPVAAPLADAEAVDGAKLSLWEYVRADGVVRSTSSSSARSSLVCIGSRRLG